MHFAISSFATHLGASPVELAVEAERLGFEAFFVSEHSHIPVATDFPLTDGGEVPMVYRSMFDPFVALAAAASVTTKIKLGTAICIVPQHDPINCAKAIATLDQLSNGRVLFGVGAGWNPPEMENHGTQFADRFRMTRERLAAMQQFWTREEAEYHGDLVNISKSWMWPKPVQQPHPPILVAGSGRNVLKRVVELGDGWMPIFAIQWHESLRNKQTPFHEFPDMLAELRNLAQAAGKAEPSISAMGLPPTAQYIEALREQGVTRMILNLPADSRQAGLEQLQTYADTVSAYQG